MQFFILLYLTLPVFMGPSPVERNNKQSKVKEREDKSVSVNDQNDDT